MLKRGMLILGLTAMWLGLTGFASLGTEGEGSLSSVLEDLTYLPEENGPDVLWRKWMSLSVSGKKPVRMLL